MLNSANIQVKRRVQLLKKFLKKDWIKKHFSHYLIVLKIQMPVENLSYLQTKSLRSFLLNTEQNYGGSRQGNHIQNGERSGSYKIQQKEIIDLSKTKTYQSRMIFNLVLNESSSKYFSVLCMLLLQEVTLGFTRNWGTINVAFNLIAKKQDIKLDRAISKKLNSYISDSRWYLNNEFTLHWAMTIKDFNDLIYYSLNRIKTHEETQTIDNPNNRFLLKYLHNVQYNTFFSASVVSINNVTFFLQKKGTGYIIICKFNIFDASVYYNYNDPICEVEFPDFNCLKQSLTKVPMFQKETHFIYIDFIDEPLQLSPNFFKNLYKK